MIKSRIQIKPLDLYLHNHSTKLALYCGNDSGRGGVGGGGGRGRIRRVPASVLLSIT